MASIAEYIWLDGAKPTQELRSKARLVQLKSNNPTASDFPEWGFDGSSTYQSQGHSSDLVLKPVRVVKDPIRGAGNFLVLCEVFDSENNPHPSNTRAPLRAILEAGGAAEEPWFGFEQEYALYTDKSPLGWPEQGYPSPQGPFYCGVGDGKVYGREVIERHLAYCVEAGLYIYGINAEVMPSQWEYQVGYRGFDQDEADALTHCDHQWLARWLLCRTAEEFGVAINFDNKPVKGDWNGSGCHTNFSTKAMRTKGKGLDVIKKAADALQKKHAEHIKVYGHGLAERLTGHHETCSINEFRCGVSDRGASIRIPLHVSKLGYGYLEDRRPGANSDPYLVAARLISTICNIEMPCTASEKATADDARKLALA